MPSENSDCNRSLPGNTVNDGNDGRIHKILISYKGYTNIYFCPDCGKRFNTTFKEDRSY